MKKLYRNFYEPISEPDFYIFFKHDSGLNLDSYSHSTLVNIHKAIFKNKRNAIIETFCKFFKG